MIQAHITNNLLNVYQLEVNEGLGHITWINDLISDINILVKQSKHKSKIKHLTLYKFWSQKKKRSVQHERDVNGSTYHNLLAYLRHGYRILDLNVVVGMPASVGQPLEGLHQLVIRICEEQKYAPALIAVPHEFTSSPECTSNKTNQHLFLGKKKSYRKHYAQFLLTVCWWISKNIHINNQRN